MSHRLLFPPFRNTPLVSSFGLVAFAVLLTSPEAFAQGRGRIRAEFEAKSHEGKFHEAAEASVPPPKYEPVSPAAARRADPIGWKSTARMPGSAPLRPIGRPFAAPAGARPPLGRTSSGPKFVTVL